MAKSLPTIELPLEWDEGNLVHAQAHGVKKEEIEQVVRNDHDLLQSRMKDGTPVPDHYLLVGETDEGKAITVVIKYPVTLERDLGTQELEMARPITAYDTPRKGG
ncbi:hypothetical protein E1293_14300 [Actinomadura darangshiensis]|uniref:DUF4258 domain-containing protein n=1 Tax=Actinomadura darangshiensis TaxID=705336 RepID=A0A4V2YW08_9ACTN|nr:hypothetical protein [Actinomadura darangshiensis]TDD83587.1 hypothetical protein E1293_14300 [Actinomadura darangshiensis]